ncbi:hypothetical protein IAQ61_007379 [Plenodomus lingam]|uniref:uncharacterized protein n=1 Tax=Leptosphaeria maculans TaxID=5022 RepID=UPI0033329C23|nr:hypothetical protein IAQ61_007379 [Plenodomus lingam]
MAGRVARRRRKPGREEERKEAKKSERGDKERSWIEEACSKSSSNSRKRAPLSRSVSGYGTGVGKQARKPKSGTQVTAWMPMAPHGPVDIASFAPIMAPVGAGLGQDRS